MVAALDLLASLPGRRVAVLGEMLELGPDSDASHSAVGAYAATQADVLMGVGGAAQIYTDAAEAAGMSPDFTHTARDRDVALRGLQHILRDGDVVLLKASNGERFFDLVDELLALAQPETVRVTIAAGIVQGILLTFALMVILMPPFIRAAAPPRHGQAHPRRRAGGALRQGRHADDGRGADDRRRRRRARCCSSRRQRQLPGSADHRADPDAAASSAAWAPPTTSSTRRPARASASARSCCGRSAVALFIAYQIQTTYNIQTLTVPFLGDVPIEPWAFVLFAAFAIVATSNGVNFTDGLDGLAGGTLIFAFVAYMIIALLSGRADQPRHPVRADHRCPAGLPVVQRPPGADLHGRFRVA